MERWQGEPRSRLLAVALSIATGLLYAAALPPFGAWPLAFACLVPLAAACSGRGPRGRAALGALAGTVAAAATCAVPAGHALALYFSLPAGAALIGVLAAGALTGGVGFGLAAVLSGDPARAPAALAALRFGAGFAVAEWVRGRWLPGLPWLPLSQALAPVPALAQIAGLAGATALTAWLATANGVGWCLVARARGGAGALGLAGGLAAAAALAGALAPPPGALRVAAPDSVRTPDALRIALVQPAPPDPQDLDPAARVRGLAAASAALPRADLLVWPESALPVLLPANRHWLAAALAALHPVPDAVLLGAPRFAPEEPTRTHNAALLVTPAGEILATHDKARLLPFTETTPDALAALGWRGPRHAPGAAPAPLVHEGTSIGVLICYEVLFPELARGLVLQGATVLVNLSNDAWFRGTAGRAQHAGAAVLRAIETRRPVLRATSDGLTMAVDRDGRVVAQLPPDAAGALLLDLPRAASEPAPAVRLGDAPALACGALVGLAAWRTRRAVPA